MEDNSPEAIEYKRTRATKACDTCRTRKLKCDGNNPCHRCQSNHVSCKYSQALRRKKEVPIKKNNKESAIDVLNDRMSRLESLMTTLADRLDPDSVNKVPPQPQTSAPLNKSVLKNLKSLDYTSPSEISTSSTSDRTGKASRIEEHPDRYFGAHSSFSVLGPRGIQWLMKVSGDESLYLKFSRIHETLHNTSVNSVTRWTESYNRSKLVPFPTREIVQPITEIFFETLGYDNLLIESNEFYEIFDLYYANVNSKDLNVEKLSSSDLLILNCVIAAGALILTEDNELDRDDPKVSHYRDVNAIHLDMAVYYYHKVCVLGEGIRTIQGILLLSLNVDLSPLPQKNYAVISTLVRQAQDMGLHRAELLTGLTPKEATKRYRLWYSVHLSDSTLCLKSGKPPIINTGDVTHLISDEHGYEFFPRDVLKRIKNIINTPGFDPNDANSKEVIGVLHKELRGNPIKLIILNYHSKLISYFSYTYDRLFKARALIGKSAEEIMDVIEELNFKLERIRLEFPRPFRPEEDGSLNEKYLANNANTDYVMLHLQYYLQVLITNRMAFKASWMNDDLVQISEHSPIIPKQEKLMRKSLSAARAILRMYLQLKNLGPFFFAFTTFYFCSAFFSLFVTILEDPTASTVRDDIILIQDSFDIFFKKISYYTQGHIDNNPTSVIFLSLKTFLKILLTTYNKNYPSDSFDTTKLDNELDLYEKLVAFVDKNRDIQKAGNADDSIVYNRKDGTPAPYSAAPPEQQYFDRPAFDPVRQSVGNGVTTPNGRHVPANAAQDNLPQIPNTPYSLQGKQSNDVLNSAYSFNDPPLHTNLISFEQLGFPDWDVDPSTMNFQQMFNLPGVTNTVDPLPQRVSVSHEMGQLQHTQNPEHAHVHSNSHQSQQNGPPAPFETRGIRRNDFF